MEDVERLRQNPLLEKEMNGWELEDGWSHIKSRYINLRQESSIQVKHRLYLGCQNQDIFKVANLFKSKCQERGIPYYFKFASNGERDDKIVVYSDTENLSNYIDILGQIAKQNPEIKNRAGNPPALTGKIDGWIGIADEPPVDEKGDNHSFNEIRAKIIEDSIEKELLRSIRDLKGKNVNYGGKNVRFNDLFISTASKTLMNLLNNKSEKNLKSAGLNRSDLSNEKFRAYLQQKLPLQIDSGLKKLWDINVGGKKYDLLASNFKAIFNLDIRNGCKLGVNTYDMDAIIKDMLPIIQEIDPNFVDKVKKNIESKCKQQGIDTKTFCFNSSTKDAFEKLSGKASDEKIQSPVQNKEDDRLENSENTELLHSILGKKDNSSVANVNYGGKNVRFNDLFISTASKTLIDKLKSKSEEELRKIGLKRDDLVNAKFDVFVQKQLRTKIMTGLNGFGQSLKNNNKDNQKAMFDVNTRAGYSFAVTLEDMESIIRSMKPIMMELESGYANKTREVSREKTEYVTSKDESIRKDVIESAEESTDEEEQIDDSPEFKSSVTASQIKELSNNKIAIEKISRIIFAGVYEKDGVKIKLSQEQKLELSNILKQASKVQQKMKNSQQLNSARTREERSISNIVEKGD